MLADLDFNGLTRSVELLKQKGSGWIYWIYLPSRTSRLEGARRALRSSLGTSHLERDAPYRMPHPTYPYSTDTGITLLYCSTTETGRG